MAPNDSLLRKINLVEVLKEQLEEEGRTPPADLTDAQLAALTEAQIRQFYLQQPAQEQQQTHEQQLSTLKARFPPQNHTTEFKATFPALFSSRALPTPEHTQAVVLCFHSSGNAEDMYTSEGTGSRRVRSALLEACQQRGWLLLAPQLPGRAQRLREQPLATLQDVAQQLLPLVAPALLAAGGRYAMVGHSLGCWTAYELMLALRQAGFPAPVAVCFSAMPWPHIPMHQRPWRQQKSLNEAEFKEECRGWDINEAVFTGGMWEMYQPMLRADFKLFDEYEPSVSQQQAREAPFNCRMRLFWGRQDRRVTEEMVQAWGSYVKGQDTLITAVDGSHLWPISDPAAKSMWLQEVAAALKESLP